MNERELARLLRDKGYVEKKQVLSRVFLAALRLYVRLSSKRNVEDDRRPVVEDAPVEVAASAGILKVKVDLIYRFRNPQDP